MPSLRGLENLGGAPAAAVRLKFEGEQLFLKDSSNVVSLPRVEAGKKTEIALDMRVGDPAEKAAVYRLPVLLSYKNGGGEEFSSQESLAVVASDLGLVEPGLATGTPRVMLGKYMPSKGQVLAGNTVTLALHIENSSPVEVQNLKISLGVIQVEGETGGTVFSPVNSSNSFYIERIGPKKVYVREIELYVDPNAAAKTYIVPVEIEYEDEDGEPYMVDEMVNIPVIQESRLQVLSIDVPPVASVNEPIPVSAEFVNVGKAALKNFLVEIEGDFQKEDASYFLPNLETGVSDYFMGMIIPQGEGLLSGNVVFTYTDNTNQEVRIEEPFEVEVQMMAQPPGEFHPGEDFPPDAQHPGGELPLTARIWAQLKWLGPLLLLLVIAAVVVIKRRRAKSGEMFDETL